MYANALIQITVFKFLLGVRKVHIIRELYKVQCGKDDVCCGDRWITEIEAMPLPARLTRGPVFIVL